MEDFQVLKKNPIKKKKVFQVFVTKSGGFWRKKTPKVEDWKFAKGLVGTWKLEVRLG